MSVRAVVAVVVAALAAPAVCHTAGWVPVESGTAADLHAVAFADPAHG